jgi:hypothetical protein
MLAAQQQRQAAGGRTPRSCARRLTCRAQLACHRSLIASHNQGQCHRASIAPSRAPGSRAGRQQASHQAQATPEGTGYPSELQALIFSIPYRKIVLWTIVGAFCYQLHEFFGVSARMVDAAAAARADGRGRGGAPPPAGERAAALHPGGWLTGPQTHHPDAAARCSWAACARGRPGASCHAHPAPRTRPAAAPGPLPLPPQAALPTPPPPRRARCPRRLLWAHSSSASSATASSRQPCRRR